MIIANQEYKPRGLAKHTYKGCTVWAPQDVNWIATEERYVFGYESAPSFNKETGKWVYYSTRYTLGTIEGDLDVDDQHSLVFVWDEHL